MLCDSKVCCGFWGGDRLDLFVDIDFDFCDPCIALKGRTQVLEKPQQLARLGRLFLQKALAVNAAVTCPNRSWWDSYETSRK
jgi:hypothetical protein